MVDVHDNAVRSRNMRAIRSKNTKPEIQIRQYLHAAGFRFRLHRKDLPGHPDIVLPKYRAVILVHGCFWHGHDCHLFKVPSSRKDFWLEKIGANRLRDVRTVEKLSEMGWRVLTIWECALKGRLRYKPEKLTKEISAWLRSGNGPASIGCTGL